MYLPPRENYAESMTPEEVAVNEQHFDYLKQMLSEGQVVMAGRPEDARFGIAVIEAGSEKEAYEIMANDPAVKEGVFSGELLPFRLALLRGGE